MKSAVEVKGVTKKFKTVTALSNVSLTVGKGELFGIIGADGAGKTTLFRILCTLCLPMREGLRFWVSMPGKSIGA